MAKADLPLPKNPLVFNVIGGIDESVQDTETDFGLSAARGVAPFYTGSIQRLFGKKIIDVDPTASIMQIAQGFNGFGTFCYWVQTFDTLFCHTCPTPADLFINYILPTNLGVDEDGFTRDIFGQSENLELPQDLGISCLFQFPPAPDPFPEIYLFDRHNLTTPGDGTLGDYDTKGFAVILISGSTPPYTGTVIQKYERVIDYNDDFVDNPPWYLEPEWINVTEAFFTQSGAQRIGIVTWAHFPGGDAYGSYFDYMYLCDIDHSYIPTTDGITYLQLRTDVTDNIWSHADLYAGVLDIDDVLNRTAFMTYFGSD